MKAAFINDYITSPDQIQVSQRPKPEAGPGLVLVKVKAASGNPADRLIGAPQMRTMFPLPFPAVIGFDFAGIVEAIGEGVTNVRAGDEVFGCNWFGEIGTPAGAFAEYMTVRASRLALKPASISWEVAASLPMAGATAYEPIVQVAKVSPGQRVLIFGGSSAVGFIGLQIAKLRGAHVTVTASTRAMSFVQQFHPDKIINYNETNWEDDPDLKGVDVIFDCIGEKDGLDRAIKSGVGKAGGYYVSVANQSLGMDPTAHPPFAWAAFYVCKGTPDWKEVTSWVAEGKLVVPIEEVFPLTKEGVVNMFTKITGMKALGKNVISIA